MRRFVFAVLTLTLLSQSGCNPNPEAESSDNRTVFRYNEPGGISSLDPKEAKNLENIWAINQLFNGLVQVNAAMEVEPCIAKSWEISEDGKEYTFHLREDVQFHDHPLFKDGIGRKVVAEDFVYSFYRVLDTDNPSAGSAYLSHLERSSRTNYLGVVATDSHTLKIYLQQAFPPFLGILTMQYFSVVPHEIANKYGVEFRRNPVGTGPFQFKMWKEDVKLVLLRNPNYFEKDAAGQQLPYLDAVAVSFIKDHGTAFHEFVLGKFDFLSSITGNIKEQALTPTGTLKEGLSDQMYLQKQPYLKTDYLGILIDEEMELVQESPLRKKAIRQAINYAIDREELITYQRYGIGSPAHAGFVPPGIPAYNADAVKGYSYDPEKARQLLKEVGYSAEQLLPEIQLSTTAGYLDLCEYVQKELEEVGIPVKIQVLENSPANMYIATGQVNFFRKSWVADYLDAENFLQLFYSKNWSPEQGSNYFHFKDERFDALYEAAMVESHDSTRYALYNQMDQIILEAAPIVPLYYDEVVRFVKPEIEGLTSNPMNLLMLKHAKKQAVSH